MTINDAVKYMGFMLKKNYWKKTDKSLKAYNTIAEFVEEKHAKQLENNQLFAKLYVYIYTKYLVHYDCTIFDSKHQIEIHKLLDQPFSYFIEELTKVLNDSEIYYTLKEYDKDIKSPISDELSHIHESRLEDFIDSTVSPEIKAKKILEFKEYKQKKREALFKAIEENPDLFTKKFFEKEEVENNLKSLINLSLNTYS